MTHPKNRAVPENFKSVDADEPYVGWNVQQETSAPAELNSAEVYGHPGYTNPDRIVVVDEA